MVSIILLLISPSSNAIPLLSSLTFFNGILTVCSSKFLDCNLQGSEPYTPNPLTTYPRVTQTDCLFNSFDIDSICI